MFRIAIADCIGLIASYSSCCPVKSARYSTRTHSLETRRTLQDGASTQHDSLLTFKISGGTISNTVLATWVDGTDHCNGWKGVTCTSGMVTRLDLWHISDLEGNIAALLDLTTLDYLNLVHTAATGDIVTMNSLTSLTELIFNNAQVMGNIEVMSSLTSLKKLQLGNAHGTLHIHVGTYRICNLA